MHREHAIFRVALIFCTTLILSACHTVYKTTGDILIGFGEDAMVPYLLQGSDTEMACASGESLTPLLMSFGEVGSKTDKVGVLVYTVAGVCDEDRAFEHELRALRALRAHDAEEAKDARIAQKRLHALAAKRQLAAYNAAIAAYGEPVEAYCPKFKSDFDELVWLFGMVAGAQALTNDFASGSQANVPKNIPAMVARGTACVDSQKWWGLPDALQAALWIILPQLKPENTDAWAQLESSMVVAEQSKVRLAPAIYLLAANSQGEQQKMRTVIKRFGALPTEQQNVQYRMGDALALGILLKASDRMWTEFTGARTPAGKLGQFWDDKFKQEDISDLL